MERILSFQICLLGLNQKGSDDGTGKERHQKRDNYNLMKRCSLLNKLQQK